MQQAGAFTYTVLWYSRDEDSVHIKYSLGIPCWKWL